MYLCLGPLYTYFYIDCLETSGVFSPFTRIFIRDLFKSESAVENELVSFGFNNYYFAFAVLTLNLWRLNQNPL